MQQPHGLFAPSRNAIAIDVRNSGSFIHELGHYYDHMVFSSQSLSKGFSEHIRDYSASLQMPEGSSGKYNRNYYATPTEVHSRAFEIFAHERLGISNRLVDISKFNNFDSAPITANPALKERMFAFFDDMLKVP